MSAEDTTETPESDSCFVSNLSAYLALTDNEREAVSALEKSEASFERGAAIHTQGNPFLNLHVVKKGWLFSSTEVVAGQRHIERIHHPGDIVGFHNLPFSNAVNDLVALEDCTLCPLGKPAIGKLLEREPRIGALFMSLAAREQVLITDFKKASQRFTASDRVLFLLIVLLSRLRKTNPDMHATIRLPMTQFQIGDAIGLSNVSVSNAMTDLTASGWIRRKRQYVTLLRLEEAESRLGYQDRFASIDISWFPEPV